MTIVLWANGPIFVETTCLNIPPNIIGTKCCFIVCILDIVKHRLHVCSCLHNALHLLNSGRGPGARGGQAAAERQPPH